MIHNRYFYTYSLYNALTELISQKIVCYNFRISLFLQNTSTTSDSSVKLNLTIPTRIFMQEEYLRSIYFDLIRFKCRLARCIHGNVILIHLHLVYLSITQSNSIRQISTVFVSAGPGWLPHHLRLVTDCVTPSRMCGTSSKLRI